MEGKGRQSELACIPGRMKRMRVPRRQPGTLLALGDPRNQTKTDAAGVGTGKLPWPLYQQSSDGCAKALPAGVTRRHRANDSRKNRFTEQSAAKRNRKKSFIYSRTKANEWPRVGLKKKRVFRFLGVVVNYPPKKIQKRVFLKKKPFFRFSGG